MEGIRQTKWKNQKLLTAIIHKSVVSLEAWSPSSNTEVNFAVRTRNTRLMPVSNNRYS